MAVTWFLLARTPRQNRPSLIDYNPVADPKAVVTSPDGMARFTVLTDRVIRMEYAKTAGVFEDRECASRVEAAVEWVRAPRSWRR